MVFKITNLFSLILHASTEAYDFAGRGYKPRHASKLMDAQLLVCPSKTQCYIALYPVNINFILLLDEQNKLFDC